MKPSFFISLRLFGFTMLIFLFAGCVGSNNVSTNTSVLSTATPSVPSSMTSTVEIPSSLPNPTIAIPATYPDWETIDNWSPANQIRAMLIDRSGYLWAGGPEGLARWDLKSNQPTIYVKSDQPDETDVVVLAETSDAKLWVGTFGNGISSFDGKNWQSFTTENGLPGNYIISLTDAKDGRIWADIRTKKYIADPGQAFHFGYFDGNHWTSGVGGGFSWIMELPDGSIMGARGNTGIATSDSIVGIYDGDEWQDLGLTRQTITAVTVAPDGVIWVTTPDSVFRYVNRTWHKITPPWAGQTAAHVSSIAVADDGTAWFGFSYAADHIDKCGGREDYVKEQGIYRYDGQVWMHFTTDDGLVDDKICAITIDPDGNVWFGSFDKGVSRFDGNEWTSYVIP